MTDPRGAHGASSAPPAGSEGMGALRTVLWGVLLVGVVGNVVVSSAGLNVLGNVVFGLITLASGAALIVQHYRNRKR
ncbi:hypothetical protein [Spirillospora sp. NPDC029432]|uniref:hypothetical protein n=1 Tax=Spirillospora sp. NPDC029432 TaxID=3154599 RepID=UPI0034565D65